MDRAEEMVLNTDEKSYKIAEKVGYQDANYFSYVFKRNSVFPLPNTELPENREQVKGKIHER